MVGQPPPDPFVGIPREVTLPAGSSLWRVRRHPRAATDFNPTCSDVPGKGGRFDATSADPFAYLYVARERSTAIVETLLRSRGSYDRPHVLRRRQLTGLRLCHLQTTRPLRLLTLVRATDLAAIYQDDWLVQADGDGYLVTRPWAAALRRQVRGADGLIWQSRRDRPKQALVLFEDRAKDAIEDLPHDERSLEGTEGERYLNKVLNPYLAFVETAGRSSGR